jgi:hypothetical protein
MIVVLQANHCAQGPNDEANLAKYATSLNSCAVDFLVAYFVKNVCVSLCCHCVLQRTKKCTSDCSKFALRLKIDSINR